MRITMVGTGYVGLVTGTFPEFVRPGWELPNVGRVRIDAGTEAGEIEGFPELGSLTTRFAVLAPGGKGNTSAGCERGALGLALGAVRCPGTGRCSGSLKEPVLALASLSPVDPALPGLTSRSVNWRCCASSRTRLEPSTRSFRWLWPTATSDWWW